ncbi:MAG: transposase, partial [Peptococcaceae bacterium]|nr:transposase [Peptococcaceae bacterium]
MYIRVTSRKNKDNTVTKYVQLAHNIRNPKSGQPQAQILYNFGRMDELDLEVLRRLAASIHRFLGEGFSGASSEGSAPNLTLNSSRSLGGTWFLDQLWKKLGIDEALMNKMNDRQFRILVERTIFAMVANRALASASKLAL